MTEIISFRPRQQQAAACDLSDLIDRSIEASPVGLPELTYFSSTERCDVLLDWHEQHLDAAARYRKMVGRAFWEALARYWIVCDGIDHDGVGDAMLFYENQHSRDIFSGDDQQFFDSLPETLVVYRGQHEPECDDDVPGLSWTTDLAIARRFATHGLRGFRGDRQVVLARVVHKDQIAFATDARGEKEVVLFPDPELSTPFAVLERSGGDNA